MELVKAEPHHADAIARIAFDAFRDISHRHGFESEIFSPEMAKGMANGFVHRPDIYGVVAIEGGEVIGHNFVQLSDAVAGVGPICVDPKRQCKGVGRLLMRHVVDHALNHHGFSTDVDGSVRRPRRSLSSVHCILKRAAFVDRT